MRNQMIQEESIFYHREPPRCWPKSMASLMHALAYVIFLNKRYFSMINYIIIFDQINN